MKHPLNKTLPKLMTRILNSLDTKTLTNQQSKKKKTFWDELRTPLIESINRALYTKIFGTSQRQAVIKLTEKKDLDKRYI